jgi:hypothetical protein
MSDIRRIGRRICLSLVLPLALAGVAVPSGDAEALPPAVVLGAWSGPEIVEQADQGSATGLRSGLDIAAGWRFFFDSGGYASVASEIAAVLIGPSSFEDREALFLSAVIPVAATTIAATAGISASFLSTEDSSAFANPSWELGWLVPIASTKLRLGLDYNGYQLHLPASLSDRVVQGIGVLLRFDPTLRWGAEVGVRGGRELWYEWPLFSVDGNLTTLARDDWTAAAQLRTDGMLGYFADWELSGSFGYRSSSANLYYSSLYLYVPDSEGRLFASAGSELSWSPHQNLALGSSLRADFAWYRGRYAIDQDGLLTQELLRRADIGVNLRGDWTPNHRVFFVVETDAGYSISNSASERGWYIRATAGVDLSF